MRARKICIMRIVDFGHFWPFFAQKCFAFSEHTFYFRAHQHETFRDQSALLGEHLSQKITLDHTYNPIFGQKQTAEIMSPLRATRA